MSERPATAAKEAASEQARRLLAPVATPSDPLFVATSVEWLMDAAIPIEIRILCQLILAKAIAEAKGEGRDFKSLGHGEATAQINVAWIIAMTGWPKNKAENVRAEAVEKGYLSVSGSSRTGYRYTITLSLRTHRANMDIPAAQSMFVRDHDAPKPKASPQLELADVASAAQPPPDMRRWSRADREFYARSPGAIRAVFSRLSGANRKLFSRLSGANQELYSRQPGANTELLSRLSGANDELCSRRSGAKKGLYNVRARSQETQNFYQKLVAEAMTPAIRTHLLLLARKREEDTDEDSATFVKALGRIIETLHQLCDGDIQRVRDTLSRLVADERVTSHENPIALMLRGVCSKPRFLLATRSERSAKTADERAYCTLPEPVQHSLRERIASGAITPEWCRERDISAGARRFAAAIVGTEKRETSSPTPTDALEDLASTASGAAEEGAPAKLCDELAARDPDEYRRRLDKILPLIEVPSVIRVERSLDHPMLLGMCRARLERELCGGR
jgi:hypothetical protein